MCWMVWAGVNISILHKGEGACSPFSPVHQGGHVLHSPHGVVLSSPCTEVGPKKSKIFKKKKLKIKHIDLRPKKITKDRSRDLEAVYFEFG